MKWFRLKLDHVTKWHIYDPERNTAFCGMVKRNVIPGMTAVMVVRTPATDRCLTCLRHLATYAPEKVNP